MRCPVTGTYIAVISHLRSQNVAKLSALIGPATWFVGAGEGEAYRNAGAANVVESGGLCESRNAALVEAFALGLPCVQLSDDLKKLERASHCEVSKSGKKATPIDLPTAINVILGAMVLRDAYYGGCAPTANLFYYDPGKAVSTRHFVVGDFIVVRPSDQRFDESLRLKEDYDFTLQHIRDHGVVARCNDVMAHFIHRTNPGGACAVRTSSLEQASIAQLKAKWGVNIQDNPRRKDEILLARTLKF